MRQFISADFLNFERSVIGQYLNAKLILRPDLIHFNKGLNFKNYPLLLSCERGLTYKMAHQVYVCLFAVNNSHPTIINSAIFLLYLVIFQTKKLISAKI